MSLKTRLFLSVLVAATGCGDDEKKSTDEGDDAADAGQGDAGSDAAVSPDGWQALDYADPASWLCAPGLDKDECLSVDLTTSEAGEGGAFESVSTEAAQSPKLDCFYIYPTYDTRPEADNATDFSDLSKILLAMRNQAARFTSVCRVIAPLYRQMTIGTYGEPGGYSATLQFERAYADVEDAFDHYLENISDGRPFVLMGHSQGTHMLTQLVAQRIDGDAALRKQMTAALLIGPVGAIHVPEGKDVGGTFKNVPLCSDAKESGCIVAFDSKGGGLPYDRPPSLPIPDGMKRACVLPTTLGGGTGNILELSIWEKDSGLPLPPAASEPFVAFRGATSAECEDDGMLGLSAVADAPAQVPLTPQNLQSVLVGRGGMPSLHIVDYNYAMGDLLRFVKAKADAL